MASKGLFRLAVLGLLLAVIVLSNAAQSAPEKHSAPDPVGLWERNPVFEQSLKARPFAYGFTTWPFAATAQAQADLMDIIAANGTMVAEHFDDKIPWGAALYNNPFPQNFVDNVTLKLSRRLTGRPLLLSLNPLNIDRSAFVDDVEGSLPTALVGKPMDDPAYIQAYTNYCIWMIDQFQPTFVLSAIESSNLLKQSPADWPAFDRFSKAVMAALQARYPDILFGESMALHTFMNPAGPGNSQDFRDTMKAHIEGFDFVGVSYYPLISGALTKTQWDDAFAFIRSWTDKPLAITESGHPAERLLIESFNIDIDFTAQDQADLVCTILRYATQGNYRFVIWWEARDFDKLLSLLPAQSQSLAKVFRDMGLQDENGKARKAMGFWRGNDPDCTW
jgi:Glycosyl hydrolase family 53